MTKANQLRLAKRMARLGTETAFEVLVKARALEAKGRDIVHLEIGEPDFDTPRNIIDAGCDALHKGFTHYGPSAGLPQLRETIAHYVSQTRRVDVSLEEVVVVPGGKPIIFFTILALVEENDEVIYPNPGFPIYESMINYVGAKAVPIRLRADLATHVARLMTNSASCTASFTQIAGVEALNGRQESVEKMCAEFKRRRDVMVAGLNKIKGFSCRLPKGAFYVFPNITKTGWPSKKLADALLDDAGVAALSGTAFGDFGEGYLRFSVANSIGNIEKALDRVSAWAKKNP